MVKRKGDKATKLKIEQRDSQNNGGEHTLIYSIKDAVHMRNGI